MRWNHFACWVGYMVDIPIEFESNNKFKKKTNKEKIRLLITFSPEYKKIVPFQTTNKQKKI